MNENKLRGVHGFFKTETRTSDMLFGILGGSGKMVVANRVSRNPRLNDALQKKLWLFLYIKLGFWQIRAYERIPCDSAPFPPKNRISCNQ